MKTKTIKISGMSCGHCVRSVEEELKKLPLNGMKVEIGKAEVTYDENNVTENDLKNAVEEAGYEIMEMN